MRIPKQSTGMKSNLSVKIKDNPYGFHVTGYKGKQIGLGDMIKKITTRIGFEPCGGCLQRAAALNKWLVFKPSQKD